MFILDSNRYGRDPEAVSNQIPAMIEKLGGEMLVSRLWEERRLAYPVKGQRKGTYWLTYFRLDGPRLVDMRRQCQITDDILRVLFLKVDPRIVDALVAHATTAPVVVSSGEGPKTPELEAEEAIPVVDAVEGPVDIEEDI
jgi:small subunit ribosomal protein S6